MFDNKWVSPQSGIEYRFSFCNMCEYFVITCPNDSCQNSSCNGGGCDSCSDDFSLFMKEFNQIEDYLTDEEKKTMLKINSLKWILLNRSIDYPTRVNFDEIKNEISPFDAENLEDIFSK